MELVVPAQTHQIYFDIKKLKRPVTIALMVVTAMLIWMTLSTAGTGTGVGSTFNTWATQPYTISMHRTLLDRSCDEAKST
ncbi:hypothetical protein ACRCLA_19310, partial [Acinetobacter baumannii]